MNLSQICQKFKADLRKIRKKFTNPRNLARCKIDANAQQCMAGRFKGQRGKGLKGMNGFIKPKFTPFLRWFQDQRV